MKHLNRVPFSVGCVAAIALLLGISPSALGAAPSTASKKTPPPPETAGPPADAAADTAAASGARSGKTVLTLAQCLERALANSKKIAAEKHRIDILSEKQEQLWWLPLSNLSLSGGISALPNKCVDISGGTVQRCGDEPIPDDYDFRDRPWGPSLHFRFKGVLPIPTSNRYPKAKEALREAKKAKQAMLPTIEHEIIFNVHRAFHGVVGAREMRYTLSQGRKHLAKAKAKVEENLENQEGSDTEIDLLKLKVFEARLEAMEKQIDQIEKTALAAMRFLVGADADDPIDLPEQPQEVVQVDARALDDYKQAALDHRPEFEALRHGVAALEAKLSTEKTALIPRLGVAFSFSAGYTPGVDIRTDDDESVPFIYQNSYNYGSVIPSVALVLDVPLDIGVKAHKIREAKAELKALLADKTYAMEGVLLEVETTYIEMTSLLETIQALEDSKKVARGWLNAAVQNHAIGLGSTKDLQDALKEYFTIMAEMHQRVGEYNIAVAKLDKVTGLAAGPGGAER